MKTYIQAQGFQVWKSILDGYTTPTVPPTNDKALKLGECYSKICLTIVILHKGTFSISLCTLIIPFLMNPELKHTFFHIYTTYQLYKMHIHLLLHCSFVYRDLCQKIQNEFRFPCHDRRSLILGLPYTGNVMTRPFSCILKAIRAQF
jgi:hypothetical protein